jgi:hypothetical protein
MTTDKGLRRHVSVALDACRAWKVSVGEPCLYRGPLSDGADFATNVRSKPFEVCGEAVILLAAFDVAVPLRLCSPAPGWIITQPKTQEEPANVVA